MVLDADSTVDEPNNVRLALSNNGETGDVELPDSSFEEDNIEQEDEDMAYYERTIQEIGKGDSYTCMICTVEMDYTCKMFACKKCYRVFDYDCIREWAFKSTEKTVDRIWKCPNCYHANKKVPVKNRATCWCGKVVNPDPNPLDPNSCGQTCNAPICPHGCSKICHLGPHPECMRMITITCQCGKHSKEIPCFQNKRQRGEQKFHCDEPCGLLLPCGIHKCQRKCHNGLCGSCKETLNADEATGVKIQCYCGQHQKDSIVCSDVKIPTRWSKDGKGKKWIGVYSCDDIRTVEYNCHKHSFAEKCIPSPTVSGTKPCPYSPKLLKTCPCGKTELAELTKPRKKCTDPIPHCENRCDKPLKCGKHTCPFTCHDGECMDPCIQIDKVKCACHQSTFLIPCGFEESPRCNIKCESLLSCRRHRCTERCCAGRPLAEQRRKNTVFRSKENINDETLVEAQHVCLKDCNLMLTCGKHRCQRKCHPGKCPPCLESDSNDLVCPCGKTIVPAPVRCGTKLPPCPYPCIKVVEGISECGHKPVPHTCHPVDQPCPPCTASVFKPCKCGKESKVRTVCFQTDVSCGQICGKPLTGCHHTCQKKCHLPGECQTKCTQICGLPRENCLHKCRKPCHGNDPCPDIPCINLVEIRCPCGRQKKEITCGATSTLESRKFAERLECDEQCEAYKRQQQLKEAFGMIDKAEGETGSVEEGVVQEHINRLKELIPRASNFEELQLPFNESVLSSYGRQSNWCSQIEDILADLVDNKDKKSLHFKPMRPPQRHFIHELAKSYNLYAESQDREPKRSVFIKKQATSCKPPARLSDIYPIYETYKQMEKERKMQEFLARTTAKLVNIKVEDDASKDHFKSEWNGFFVRKLTHGTNEDDLKNLFDKHLKSTLVKDVQYKIVKDTESGYNDAIIYPAEYAKISANAAKDMEALVTHFDYMVKESFIADSVELCDVSELLDESPALSVVDTTIGSPAAIEEDGDDVNEDGFKRLETPGLEDDARETKIDVLDNGED
ncbi:FKBP12-associated protein 1 [Monosporozyma unispora]|nr:FKBP12-associated protein [Kazachstania unispora]